MLLPRRKVNLKALHNSLLRNKKIIEQKTIDLNDKVDLFDDWNFKNMIKGHFTKIGEYNNSKKMKNLIEKVAVWYELAYPDYMVDNVMFEGVQYINKLPDRGGSY